MQTQTFFESCGVADLMTTCYGGRNRKCAEAFVRNPGKGWERIEAELLNGQKLQGTITAQDVMTCLTAKRAQGQFPLFVTVFNIAFKGLAPANIVNLG